MGKVRFRYSKTGRAKYISHLDLMAIMQRSFIRAGINLKYSEGFNPHPYMSVALPLSVGCQSVCELMDVAIADDAIPEIKKIKLPEGIEISDAYTASRKFAEISWIETCGSIFYDKMPDNDLINRLNMCFSKESVVISKRSKRGVKELDIAPFIKDVAVSMETGIKIRAKISAQNPTLNTDDLINVIDSDIKPDFTSMKRIAIYDSNMILFT